MADSIILATGHLYEATIWTQDSGFKGIPEVQPGEEKSGKQQGLRRARCRFIPGKSAGWFSPPADRQALAHRVESTEHDKPDCLHLRWRSDLPGELTAKWVKH